jgi:peptidoglycan-associated lipoprotein
MTLSTTLPGKLLLVVAASLLLTACPKKPTTVANTGAGSEVPAAGTGSATTGGDASGSGVGTAQPLPDTGGSGASGADAALLSRTVIYFDFDSSEVRGDFADVVAAHARHLSAGGGLHVRLEGHTDERGSREYNIGLGERRAQAVRRALMLQGAPDASISTVSYGEEKPAVDGSGEDSWAQNRRVEIVYASAP